jgi:hypothetical protein
MPVVVDGAAKDCVAESDCLRLAADVWLVDSVVTVGRVESVVILLDAFWVSVVTVGPLGTDVAPLTAVDLDEVCSSGASPAL